jgi:ribosomal protein S4
MSNFKKPRYKAYLRLGHDIRKDFIAKKFKSAKWEIFKLQLKKKKLQFFSHVASQLTKKNSLLDRFGTKRLKNQFRENLLTKQRLNAFYNLQNFKLKKLVQQSTYKKTNILYFLEKRLDVSLFRTGLVNSLFQSRQLINHKKVFVNKQLQSQSNFILKKGDLIEIKENLALPYLNLENHNLKQKKFPIVISKTALPYITTEKNVFIVPKEIKILPIQGLQHVYKGSRSLDLSNHLEINYPTCSAVFLNTISLKKSFKFWTNTQSLLTYYKTN